MDFWNFGAANPLRELAAAFLAPFPTTFIFYASPSDFPIKSYGRLKFSAKNALQLEICTFFPTCEDSSVKYTLSGVTTKKFGSKNIFYLFLMNFSKLLSGQNAS